MHPDDPSRRDWLAALAALAAPALAAAQPKADATSLEEQADALLALIKSRHGKHLDAEQEKALKRALVRHLASMQRLGRTKLTNGDEPAVVFHAEQP
jgi:ABC-type transporter MlaC component